MNKEPHRWFNG